MRSWLISTRKITHQKTFPIFIVIFIKAFLECNTIDTDKLVDSGRNELKTILVTIKTIPLVYSNLAKL